MNLLLQNYMCEINKAITSLQEAHKKHFAEELFFASRGEPKHYMETKLMPSIFREPALLHKEPYLFELLCDYNMVPSNASYIEKAIDAQHYIAISRMLDISFNVLVSIFFACYSTEKGIEKENGSLYIFGFPKKYSPNSDYIQDFYTHMLNKSHIPYSKNFKIFSHSFTNERIKAQKGGFIFFPGSNFCPIDSCYYREITVDKDHKSTLLKELEILFGIKQSELFPEKDNIGKDVKEKFKNSSYSNQQVQIADEITTYFERITYEMTLHIGNNIALLRRLRKEKSDLKTYVKSYFKEKESAKKDDLLNLIDKNFDNLTLKYKEVSK